MSSVTSAPRKASGPLILADISGYTSFLQSVTQAHEHDAFADGAVPDAYAVISSLLDGIVGRLVPPFTLSKLEGDAVFAYSEESAFMRGQPVLDCIGACYADFRRRVKNAQAVSTCWCNVCMRLDQLDLKFILHVGPFVIQDIAGQRELVGPEVVIAHRLLKSQAGSSIDRSAYALVTDAAAAELAIPIGNATPITETHEHYEPVAAHVFALGGV
jgi:hypothetical protein